MATDRESGLLKPRGAAAFLGVSRSMLSVLVDRESLPCVLVAGGGGRRRVLRFEPDRLREWIEGRRERQVRGLLLGHRYRRRVVSLEGGA